MTAALEAITGRLGMWKKQRARWDVNVGAWYRFLEGSVLQGCGNGIRLQIVNLIFGSSMTHIDSEYWLSVVGEKISTWCYKFLLQINFTIGNVILRIMGAHFMRLSKPSCSHFSGKLRAYCSPTGRSRSWIQKIGIRKRICISHVNHLNLSQYSVLNKMLDQQSLILSPGA